MSEVKKILLCTINAKFVHASLGLRYLYANLHELQNKTEMVEYHLKQSENGIVEDILKRDPLIVGIGVYIWNIELVERIVPKLQKLKPDLKIILGGPEVSHGEISFEKVTILKGEADQLFYQTCKKQLDGHETNLHKDQPDLLSINLPYEYYDEEDIKNRIIYVESSRGCVFKCEFCLSSLDERIRRFDLDQFLEEMKLLLDKGCRIFKFVDRTFNMKIKDSLRILNFFLDHMKDDLFVHFEMIPDHFPDELKEVTKKFPVGSLQFEIGLQSFTPVVLENISRKMKMEKVYENLEFLTNQTQAHLHTDLIVGLPGETTESFEDSFNTLYQFKPHEIQVGILKRLKGAPVIRHTDNYEMIYEEKAPFEILQTRDIPFQQMQNLKRFARYIEIFYNHRPMHKALDLLIQQQNQNAFQFFMNFGNWIWEKYEQEHAIGLKFKCELLFQYAAIIGVNQAAFIDALADDFMDPHSNPDQSQKSLPEFLRKAVDQIRREISKIKANQ